MGRAGAKRSNGSIIECADLMQTITVKDFETDGDLDQIVWRYLTFEKFISLLEFSAIWFSRLGALQKLEDEFEGKLPTKAKEKVLQRHKEWEKQMPSLDFKEILHKAADNTINKIGDGLVVNCWCLSEAEDQKMWNKYVPDGRGVSIRSTIRRLGASLDIRGDYKKLTLLGRVKYVDFDEYDMDINTTIDSAHRAFLKRINDYDFEKEVRIVTMNVLRRGCLHPDGRAVLDSELATPCIFDAERNGFYINCSLVNLIDSIVLSPQRPPHFLNLITRLLKRYGLQHIPLMDSSLKETRSYSIPLVSTVKVFSSNQKV
jgi:hypothetical protein